MSNIIIPGEEPAEKKGIIGKRCKGTEAILELCGQLLCLRAAGEIGGLAIVKKTGFVGIITCVKPLATYAKRIDGIGVMAFTGPGQVSFLPANVLEQADPWCHPPGFPERAVSLLEE